MASRFLGKGLGVFLTGGLLFGCTDDKKTPEKAPEVGVDEVVPAGEPEKVEGTALAARYWVEISPMDGRMDMFGSSRATRSTGWRRSSRRSATRIRGRRPRMTANQAEPACQLPAGCGRGLTRPRSATTPSLARSRVLAGRRIPAIPGAAVRTSPPAARTAPRTACSVGRFSWSTTTLLRFPTSCSACATRTTAPPRSPPATSTASTTPSGGVTRNQPDQTRSRASSSSIGSWKSSAARWVRRRCGARRPARARRSRTTRAAREWGVIRRRRW